jgi:hypothetical protein
MHSSSCLSLTAIKPKAEYELREDAMMFFLCSARHYFQCDYHHTGFQEPVLSAANVALLLQIRAPVMLLLSIIES